MRPPSLIAKAQKPNLEAQTPNVETQCNITNSSPFRYKKSSALIFLFFLKQQMGTYPTYIYNVFKKQFGLNLQHLTYFILSVRIHSDGIFTCASLHWWFSQDMRSAPSCVRLRCDRKSERLFFALCWEFISSSGRFRKCARVWRSIPQLGGTNERPGWKSSASTCGDSRRNRSNLLRAPRQCWISETLCRRRGEISCWWSRIGGRSFS